MVGRKEETWRSPVHRRAPHGVQRMLTVMRRLLDLQMGSIWADASAELPGVHGAALDVGCGGQPFRTLFDPAIRYIGIDTIQSKAHFGYETPDTLYYEGEAWPIEDGSVDFVLCTETLEHVPEAAPFLAQAARCLVPGGRIFLTVPFAARWHFIPYDYWRFTPSSLERLLTAAGFCNIAVFARGNEVTVACYKSMALLLPLLLPQDKGPFVKVILRFIALVFLPFLVLFAAIGNLSLLGAGGDDCLGYTVIAEKGPMNA